MDPVVLTATRGRLALRMTCVVLGGDLAVTLSGGDREHIGAVALAQPVPGREGTPPRAGTSVLVIPGHREDDLARELASHLCARLGRTVCLACGIHLDAITREELEDVQALSWNLAGQLGDRLDRAPGRAENE